MNKKGFTIVELLVTIVILGIILTIVYPAVTSTINSSRVKAHNSQIKVIEKAMKLYYLEHSENLKDLNNAGTMDGCSESTVSVNATTTSLNPNTFIQTLIDEGYISDNETKNGKLIDPCTDKDISEGAIIEVNWSCNTKQYEYKFKPNSTCN